MEVNEIEIKNCKIEGENNTHIINDVMVVIEYEDEKHQSIKKLTIIGKHVC